MNRGTVILVGLDPTVGHEQRGRRPCIAISDPAVNDDQLFPLIAVVPVTGTRGEGALYPQLSPGNSGLTKTSYALIDHIRSIDKRRIQRVYGMFLLMNSRQSTRDSPPSLGSNDPSDGVGNHPAA